MPSFKKPLARIAISAAVVAAVALPISVAPATASEASAATLTTNVVHHTVSAANANRAIARQIMARKYHWYQGQFTCLNKLWKRESGWRTNAHSGSGAHGIPQALPGSKMSSAGPNWRSNPSTQIKWGLKYIKGRYGTPCRAWAHSQRTGWY